LWAQRNGATLPYRTFETFQGDTAQYLEYNYTIRNVQYVGKTVKEILDELEFPVLYISPMMQSTSGCNDPTVLLSLGLIVRQVATEPSELKDYYITVRFESPPLLDEFRKVSPRDNRGFSLEIYDFIKDLRVSMVESNEYIARDPELLEIRRRVSEEGYRRGREGQERWDRIVREREDRERREESERRDRERERGQNRNQ
jgi:hypothetical protein